MVALFRQTMYGIRETDDAQRCLMQMFLEEGVDYVENKKFMSPASIKDACSLLSRSEGKVVILAGGTDLMPRYNKRKPALRPDLLISLGKLDLDYIRLDGETLVIGACSTHSDISNSELVKKYVPLLAKACSEIGSPAIRNAGTIGGNVCNAAPWADSIAALLALDATVVIASENGERAMKIEEFVKGPSSTDIKRGEVLQEFNIPVMSSRHKWAWTKFGQRKGSFISIASVAANMEVDSGISRSVRIAIGAVGRIPYISQAASASIEGRQLSEALANAAGSAVSEEAKPREDGRAAGWYRQEVVGTIVKRSLNSMI